MLQRLSKGESLAHILDSYKDMEFEDLPEVQQKEWTEEQINAGLECIDEIIESLSSLLVTFGYKLEGIQVQLLSIEQRKTLLQNLDSIVAGIKNVTKRFNF